MNIDKYSLFRKARFIVLITLMIVIFSQSKVPAQEPQTTPLSPSTDLTANENTDSIIVNTNLITFNVRVSDINGAAVTGLSKNDFNILDNKIPQEIHFFSAGDAPASVSIVLDTSASMSGGKIIQAKEALAHFIQTSKEQDEFFLIDVGSQANLLLSGTRDSDAVLEKFRYVFPQGKTALYDAVNLGLEKAKNGTHAKKIMLIISDGEDNNSRTNLRSLKKQLKESDVIIYTIGISSNYPSMRKGLSGKDVLNELASVSGGKSFFPDNSDEMNDVFDRIALEIRHIYSIGYYPSDLAVDGKNHQVTVRVKKTDETPRLFVQSRKAYIAGQLLD